MRLTGCHDIVLPGSFDPTDPTMEDETIWGLDLGSGVWISPFSDYQEPFARAEGVEADHIGGIVWHVHEDRRVCGGAVYFAPRSDGPAWTVESWDPLTLSPSILARSGPGGAECLHGYIRAGRWESC